MNGFMQMVETSSGLLCRESMDQNLEIKNILIKNKIKKIFFTSRHVENLFSKVFQDISQLTNEIELICLPSPSPRYAAMSKSEKISRYKQLLPRLVMGS